jgi:hypothetical protein
MQTVTIQIPFVTKALPAFPVVEKSVLKNFS